MNLRHELQTTKPMEPGQEVLVSLLLTREFAGRLSEERLFKPAEITDQQFNVLRILKGGPKEGYLIREIRRRMISRNADVPRLADRMVRAGLVQRCENPSDRRGCLVRLTPEGEALEARLAPLHTELCREVGGLLNARDTQVLLELLDQLREGLKARLAAVDGEPSQVDTARKAWNQSSGT